MMFDLSMSNPPYDGRLHLKIVDALNSVSVESVVLHPARWLHEGILGEFDPKSKEDKLARTLSESLKSVELIQGKHANLMMKIGGNTDLMIGDYIPGSSLPSAKVYSDVALDVLGKVSRKVSSDGMNFASYAERDMRDGIRVSLNTFLHSINGGMTNVQPERSMKIVMKDVLIDGMTEDGRDWTETRNRNQFLRKPGSTIPLSIKVDSVEEAHNLIDSCETEFFNNWCQLITTNQNPKLHLFPWMGDYSRKWTNEMYCRFFELDDSESRFMSRTVDDYRFKSDFIHYDDRFKVDYGWGTKYR